MNRLGDQRMPADQALAAAGLAVAQLTRGLATATSLTALLCDVLGTRPDFTAPQLFDALGHADTADTATIMRRHLTGLNSDHARPLQEPYTLRCSPHLLGARRPSTAHGRALLDALVDAVPPAGREMPLAEAVRVAADTLDAWSQSAAAEAI